MKILHIASFTGNIGDNISHLGLEIILENFFAEFQLKRLEIRKFYKNYTGKDKHYFDFQFLNEMKDFDLCIIGGGGFLDYWVEGSESGTTIDMSVDLVSRISTPTLICSVGCIPHRPVPDGNLAKFTAFLDACKCNPFVQIILRNDGSFLNINKLFGNSYVGLISEGIDNAFFIKGNYHCDFPVASPYIAINLSNDQLLMDSKVRGTIDQSIYYKQLAETIAFICDYKNINVIFIPHIHSDLLSISRLLSELDDYVIRERISVAPCVQFKNGAKYNSEIYKNAELTIAIRFHANIIPLALGSNAIGIVALDRVKHMYDSLGLQDNYVFADGYFANSLCEKIMKIVDGHRATYSPSFLEDKKALALQSYAHAISSIGLARYLNV